MTHAYPRLRRGFSGISMDGITVSKPFHAIPRVAFLAGSISIGKMVTKFHQLAASQHILAVMRGHLRSCRVYTLFQKVHAFVSDSDFWTPNVGDLSAKNEGLRLLRWAMTSQPLNGLVVCPYVFVSCRMPLVAWKMSTSMTFSMWPDQRTQAARPSFFFRCPVCNRAGHFINLEMGVNSRRFGGLSWSRGLSYQII